MDKVLIMVEDGSDDVGFSHTFNRFQEEGYKVDVVAPKAKVTYRGNRGVPMRSDISPKEVNVDEYDAVIIPGGKGPAKLCKNGDLIKIVKEAYEKGKIIAAICAGPRMLIAADILRGKKATRFRSLADDIEEAGATFVDAAVVVDGNIVTSRFPPDLPHFCEKALDLLKNRK